MSNRLFCAVCAALLLTAGIAPAHASHGINTLSMNGTQINGHQQNGHQQNALSPNGTNQADAAVRDLNGVRAESVTLPADAAR